MSEWPWNRRTELVEVYDAGRQRFREVLDDGGWADPKQREHEAGLLAVAEHASHSKDLS